MFHTSLQSPFTSIGSRHSMKHDDLHIPKLYHRQPPADISSSALLLPSDPEYGYTHAGQMIVDDLNLPTYLDYANHGTQLPYEEFLLHQDNTLRRDSDHFKNIQDPQTRMEYSLTPNSSSSFFSDYSDPSIPNNYMTEKIIYLYDSVMPSPSPSPSPSTSPSGPSAIGITDTQGDQRSDPPVEETEKYLRRTLSIPDHVQVNLFALPNEPFRGNRPKIPDLIKLAIWGSPDHKMTLRDIYDAVEARYPSYNNQKDKPWQRSIRHALSLKAMFVHEERPVGMAGKGSYWKLNVRNGEGNKRDRNRRRRMGRDDQSVAEEGDDNDVSDTSSASYASSSFSLTGAQHHGQRSDIYTGVTPHTFYENTMDPSLADVSPTDGVAPRGSYMHDQLGFQLGTAQWPDDGPRSSGSLYPIQETDHPVSAQDTHDGIPIHNQETQMERSSEYSTRELSRGRRLHSEVSPDTEEMMKTENRGERRTRHE